MRLSSQEQRIISTATLDHILCTHNLESAEGIADILNNTGPYDHVGFEMAADEATRGHHRLIMQAIVDGQIDKNVVLANVDPRDAFHKVVALLDFSDTVIYTPDTIDPDFRRIPTPTDTIADMIWDRGRQNITREPVMLDGVVSMILTNGCEGQKAALVTGALHTYPSTELKKLGALVNRHFVMDYEAIGYEDERPLGIERLRYPDILAAQRAVRYGLADKLDLENHFLAE